MWGCCKVACTGWRAWFERVRSPSASSAPLKRAQYGAPSAHPAIESPLCARDAQSNWTAARTRAAFRKRAS
eukprot:4484369-Prymnesium_polylepis.1